MNEEIYKTMRDIGKKSKNCLTLWGIEEKSMFDVKSNGSIGFEVIDPNGQTVCWTVLNRLPIESLSF